LLGKEHLVELRKAAEHKLGIRLDLRGRAAILCVIPYKISVGSNPARYVYVILCCLSALLVLADGDAGMKKPDVIAGLLGVPFTVFSIFRLFQAPANTWFSGRSVTATARR
jgi:hypothetical protein